MHIFTTGSWEEEYAMRSHIWTSVLGSAVLSLWTAPAIATPASLLATAAVSATVLSSVSNPPSKISIASVMDATGQTVGAVETVETNADGMPIRLRVALTGKEGKSVDLDAGSVRYDPVKNVILAQQTAEQIRAQAPRG
jgi:hypothetical protein